MTECPSEKETHSPLHLQVYKRNAFKKWWRGSLNLQPDQGYKKSVREGKREASLEGCHCIVSTHPFAGPRTGIHEYCLLISNLVSDTTRGPRKTLTCVFCSWKVQRTSVLMSKKAQVDCRLRSDATSTPGSLEARRMNDCLVEEPGQCLLLLYDWSSFLKLIRVRDASQDEEN